jgi:hypothetical protein
MAVGDVLVKRAGTVDPSQHRDEIFDLYSVPAYERGTPLLSIPAVAHADACVNGTVQLGGSGGDYFLSQGGAWLHVVPTFDPNSADGYGPNQPLPPLCVRFPDQYICPTDGPPSDAGGTGF